MSARARWSLTLLAVAGVVLGACTPVRPPPPPQPDPAVGPAATVAAEVGALTLCPGGSTPPEPTPTPEAPVEYVATVDEPGPDGRKRVTFTAGSVDELRAEVAGLEAGGEVVTLEPERPVHALVVTPDDDPLFDNTVDFPPVVARQYGLHEDYMNFEAAWASGWDGTDVIIAIVDSGVVLNHEDLVDNLDLANAFDFVQNDSVPQDGFGHGTHVAGIAAAVDNDKGGIGGAPEATILPIRVLGNTGSGGSDDVADGIDHAVANDADIINLSLGGTGCNNDIQLAIENALAAGVVVVAAGGNCGAGASLICPIKNAALYPAAGPDTDVIAVGATNESAVRANFSNWNPQKKYTLGWPSPSRYLDVAASGNVIGSTYIPNMDSYFNLSGTSMAAPYVSAAAALLIQKCGVGTPLTSRQVKLMLEATAEEIFGETTRIEFTPPIRTDLGYGLIQVGAAAALPCPA